MSTMIRLHNNMFYVERCNVATSFSQIICHKMFGDIRQQLYPVING